jgi:hypothetical protein
MPLSYSPKLLSGTTVLIQERPPGKLTRRPLTGLIFPITG